MKVNVEIDELYPFYFLTNSKGSEVNISEDKLNEWKKTTQKFKQMQDEMQKELGIKDTYVNINYLDGIVEIGKPPQDDEPSFEYEGGPKERYKKNENIEEKNITEVLPLKPLTWG